MNDVKPIDPGLAKKAAERLRVEAKQVIYLSGPMTGYEKKNFPAFERAAKNLRSMGHRVYSPHERPGNDAVLNTDNVRMAFASYCSFICLEATAIVLLKGWTNSVGCLIEFNLARKCNLLRYLYVDTDKKGILLPNPYLSGKLHEGE